MHLNHLLGSLWLCVLVNLSDQRWDSWRWLFIFIFSWSVITLRISISSFLNYNFLIVIVCTITIRWLLVWLSVRVILLLKNNLATLLNPTTTRISSIVLLTRTLHGFAPIWIFWYQLDLMRLSCLRRTSVVASNSVVATSNSNILQLDTGFNHTLMSLMSMWFSFSLLQVLLKILKILSLTELISYSLVPSNSFISCIKLQSILNILLVIPKISSCMNFLSLVKMIRLWLNI